MDRTPAQVLADAALEKAVRDTASAYGLIGESSYIGDWVIVASVEAANDEEEVPPIVVIPSEMAWHSVVGLLRGGEKVQHLQEVEDE